MKYDPIILNIFISNGQHFSIIIVIKCLIFVFNHLILKFNANLRIILFIH